jgi:hypothetical protein
MPSACAACLRPSASVTVLLDSIIVVMCSYHSQIGDTGFAKLQGITGISTGCQADSWTQETTRDIRHNRLDISGL